MEKFNNDVAGLFIFYRMIKFKKNRIKKLYKKLLFRYFTNHGISKTLKSWYPKYIKLRKVTKM